MKKLCFMVVVHGTLVGGRVGWGQELVTNLGVEDMIYQTISNDNFQRNNCAIKLGL